MSTSFAFFPLAHLPFRNQLLAQRWTVSTKVTRASHPGLALSVVFNEGQALGRMVRPRRKLSSSASFSCPDLSRMSNLALSLTQKDMCMAHSRIFAVTSREAAISPIPSAAQTAIRCEARRSPRLRLAQRARSLSGNTLPSIKRFSNYNFENAFHCTCGDGQYVWPGVYSAND